MNPQLSLALAAGWVLGFAFMNIPSALDCMMDLYGASYTRLSVLMSALFWTHALAQIPAGVLVDRTGLKANLKFCLLAMSLGSLLPALHPSLELAVTGRILTGLGTGLSFPTLLKMIALYSLPRKIGSYQAFFGGAFSMGCIATYLLIPRLIPFGWQWAYLVPGLLCLPLLAAAFFLDVERRPAVRSSVGTLARVFRLRQAWVIGIYHCLSWGSVLALGSWVPSLLAEVAGGSKAADFAWGGALIMLVSGIGRLSGGVILFRFPAAFIANGSIVALCAFFLLLLFIRQALPVLVLTLCAGWFASINFGALFHLISRSSPQGSMGTLLGLVNMLANLGAVAFTFMFGWMKDHQGSFTSGFAVQAAVCILAVLAGRSSLRKVEADPE
jgi:nitrate/nitrite transporter NarK